MQYSKKRSGVSYLLSCAVLFFFRFRVARRRIIIAYTNTEGRGTITSGVGLQSLAVINSLPERFQLKPFDEYIMNDDNQEISGIH